MVWKIHLNLKDEPFMIKLTLDEIILYGLRTNPHHIQEALICKQPIKDIEENASEFMDFFIG
jgi:hypothetical protein